VALERHEHDAVVRPNGELDADAAPQLERALGAVQAPGRRVVLDLRELRSGEEAGLRVIVAALDRAERLDAELRLIPGDVAERMFAEAGLSDRLASVTIEAEDA
jgi:anti-anti-sigma factor